MVHRRSPAMLLNEVSLIRGIVLIASSCVAVLLIGGASGALKAVIGTYMLDVGLLMIWFLAAVSGQLSGRMLARTGIRRTGAFRAFGLIIGMIFLISMWMWFAIMLQIHPAVEAVTGTESFHFPWENPVEAYEVIKTYVGVEGLRMQLLLLTFAGAVLTKVFYVVAEFPGLTGAWLIGFWVFETTGALALAYLSCTEQNKKGELN